MAVGLGVGSDGIGPDLLFKLSPNFVIGARATYGPWVYHKEGPIGGVFYFKGNTRVSTVNAHIDLHPWGEGMGAPLFIAGGAMGGERTPRANGRYTGAPVPIGNGQFLTPGSLGVINVGYKVSDVAPFAGIGWDNTFTKNSPWGLRLFAGVALNNVSPAVTASGGQFSTDSRIQPLLHSLEHPNNSEGTKYWTDCFPFTPETPS